MRLSHFLYLSSNAQPQHCYPLVLPPFWIQFKSCSHTHLQSDIRKPHTHTHTHSTRLLLHLSWKRNQTVHSPPLSTETWQRLEYLWGWTACAVRSAARFSGILSRFPVGTTSAWGVFRTAGIARRGAALPAAVLNVATGFPEDLCWSRTQLWLTWWGTHRPWRELGPGRKQEVLYVGGTASHWMFTAAQMRRSFAKSAPHLSTQGTLLGLWAGKEEGIR